MHRLPKLLPAALLASFVLSAFGADAPAPASTTPASVPATSAAPAPTPAAVNPTPAPAAARGRGAPVAPGIPIPPSVAWAYAINTPGVRGHPDDGQPKSVPNSEVRLTRAQITGRGAPVADWHPGDHPPMPDIVGKPRTNPNMLACGYCHLPNGAGRPENTSLSGLTPNYFKQQVRAFQKDERPGAEPRRGPQTAMIAAAKAMSDEELELAANYFASIKPTDFLEVVETDTVPKIIVAGWMHVKAPGDETEPLGNRIVELSADFERFELRDSRIPYTAYVPVGSIKRGSELVNNPPAGKTIQCTICHGPGLKGGPADNPAFADVPRLAGRSPSYLMRQLFDMKHDKRTGAQTALMKPVVANLSDEDMLAIVAYIASLDP